MAAKRSPSKEMLVYSANVNLGWRIVRNTSFVKGERLVEQGVYRRIFDDMGKHVGYQANEDRRTDRDLPSRQTTAALSAVDARAIAGEFGRSKTAGLEEDKRLDRRDPVTGKLLEPEDFVERAIEKVKLYTQPAPGRGDKAIRVYPKGPTSNR